MKAIIKTSILSFIVLAFAYLLSSCKKDEEMKVLITVKMQADSSILVPNAKVTITKGQTTVEGYSDANGQFTHTYKLEAIFDVIAQKSLDSVTTLYGESVIRLKPGETVYKTVFIK
jgi:hypothetical protein